MPTQFFYLKTDRNSVAETLVSKNQMIYEVCKPNVPVYSKLTSKNAPYVFVTRYFYNLETYHKRIVKTGLLGASCPSVGLSALNNSAYAGRIFL